MEFVNCNNNPKNKITNDCVIRAIALATNNKWENVYRELAEQGIKKGLMINDRNNWKAYLKSLGYEQQKMPRKVDRKRYTLKEFCEELAEKDKIYIVKVAGHLTCIKDKKLYDTWNCSNKCVGNYWIEGRN